MNWRKNWEGNFLIEDGGTCLQHLLKLFFPVVFLDLMVNNTAVDSCCTIEHSLKGHNNFSNFFCNCGNRNTINGIVNIILS